MAQTHFAAIEDGVVVGVRSSISRSAEGTGRYGVYTHAVLVEKRKTMLASGVVENAQGITTWHGSAANGQSGLREARVGSTHTINTYGSVETHYSVTVVSAKLVEVIVVARKPKIGDRLFKANDECPECSAVGKGPLCKAHTPTLTVTPAAQAVIDQVAANLPASTPHSAHWVDEAGHVHGTCACGNDCSTHPDAAYPLAGCGDCGADTCPDCRVEDAATRCNACAAKFYAKPAAAPPEVEIKFIGGNGSPAGKLADAELHISSGFFAGLKLIGFGVWERRDGGRNVTFPARQYSVNGERRSFALLRPTGDLEAQNRLRDQILAAYATFEKGGN